MGQGQIKPGSLQSSGGGLSGLMQMISMFTGSGSNTPKDGVGTGTVDNYDPNKAYAPGSNMPGPYNPTNPTQGPSMGGKYSLQSPSTIDNYDPTKPYAPGASQPGPMAPKEDAMGRRLESNNHMNVIDQGLNHLNDPNVKMDYPAREEAYKTLLGAKMGLTQRHGEGKIAGGERSNGKSAIGTIASVATLL